MFETEGVGVRKREQVQKMVNTQKCLREKDMRHRDRGGVGGLDCASPCVCLCICRSFSGYLIGTRVLSVLCTDQFDVSPT